MIPLSIPNFKGNELKYVTQAIETEWVSTAGAFITEFEEKICDYTKAKNAVACQSGTSGLHLAMLALGIGENDEVLVPTLTFIAAVNPVKYVGAEPVFFDCDDSLTIDYIKLKSFIENECDFDGKILTDKANGKRVAAIVVVHVFGNMDDMENIMPLAKKYGLPVIEDATEALGTKYETGEFAGRFAGTIGDIGVYSFNGNKIITTGGGGMIVTDNSEYANHCRHLSTQAKTDLVYFDHDKIGYNYRMTNLQAALGLAQLEQLEDFIANKQENYELYKSLGIELLEYRKDIRSNYWFYCHLTNYRDGLIKYLAEHDIQARPIWKLIHTLKPYENSKSVNIKVAKDYYNKIINIPCSSSLTKDEVKIVAEAICDYEVNR